MLFPSHYIYLLLRYLHLNRAINWCNIRLSHCLRLFSLLNHVIWGLLYTFYLDILLFLYSQYATHNTTQAHKNHNCNTNVYHSRRRFFFIHIVIIKQQLFLWSHVNLLFYRCWSNFLDNNCFIYDNCRFLDHNNFWTLILSRLIVPIPAIIKVISISIIILPTIHYRVIPHAVIKTNGLVIYIQWLIRPPTLQIYIITGICSPVVLIVTCIQWIISLDVYLSFFCVVVVPIVADAWFDVLFVCYFVGLFWSHICSPVWVSVDVCVFSAFSIYVVVSYWSVDRCWCFPWSYSIFSSWISVYILSWSVFKSRWSPCIVLAFTRISAIGVSRWRSSSQISVDFLISNFIFKFIILRKWDTHITKNQEDSC